MATNILFYALFRNKKSVFIHLNNFHRMTAQELEARVWEKAKEYGILTKTMKETEKKRGTPNAVKRSNIGDEAYQEGKAYFGYVRPEENPNHGYYDLSFVVFPQKGSGKCVVSLGLGSAGYQRDYELASTAGIRRLFLRLTKNDGYSFIKNDFTDIETPFKELCEKADNELDSIRAVIKLNEKNLLASRIVDPDTEFEIIEAWLAQYASIRGWGTKQQKKEQEKAINKVRNNKPVNIQEDIKKLLKNRRFVVLQGAPGTGKTYNAIEISKNYARTHFIQFHAETTYADFVEGIRPNLSNKRTLTYKQKEGILIDAIKSAEELKPKNQRVLLIIDEINRANLANVLGPVFYLFEDQSGTRPVTIKIAGKEIHQLPDNLDVIATMNTADRSLAVVDFALRRRFAWYTIRPQIINASSDQKFHKDLFERFCTIFDFYATDEELNLQPGPSYFLTPKQDSEDIIKDRLIYELMPLIKEYLAEGLMRKAADSFTQLFYEKAGKYLYE